MEGCKSGTVKEKLLVVYGLRRSSVEDEKSHCSRERSMLQFAEAGGS
jgi:hypothetical protein